MGLVVSALGQIKEAAFLGDLPSDWVEYLERELPILPFSHDDYLKEYLGLSSQPSLESRFARFRPGQLIGLYCYQDKETKEVKLTLGGHAGDPLSISLNDESIREKIKAQPRGFKSENSTDRG